MSLLIAPGSSVAGCVAAAPAVVRYRVIAESMFGNPPGTTFFLLMLPIGLIAWVLGYIAFAACCYRIHHM